MRVTQGMIANNVRFNLQQGLGRVDSLAYKLATGKSFHRPLENPVGNYKVMRYNTVINYNDRYRKNMNESKGWLEASEIAMMDGLQLLQRIRELTVYAANDTLTDLERRIIAQEIKEYHEAFVGMANKDFNGLHIFAGHQTMERPYIEQKIYEVNGLPEAARLEADGLRQGDYNVTTAYLADPDPAAAKLTTSQQLLQGTSNSIVGKANYSDYSVDAGTDRNASILLEIKDINHNTGEVKYEYSSHEYDKAGIYRKHTGHFTLVFGGEDTQTAEIGNTESNIKIEFNDLAQYAGRDIADIVVGDKAVLSLQAAGQAGNHRVDIGADFREGSAVIDGAHRDGSAALSYSFNHDAYYLEDIPPIKFHTLNLFKRSGFYGDVYNNNISVDYRNLSVDPSKVSAGIHPDFDNVWGAAATPKVQTEIIRGESRELGITVKYDKNYEHFKVTITLAADPSKNSSAAIAEKLNSLRYGDIADSPLNPGGGPVSADTRLFRIQDALDIHKTLEFSYDPVGYAIYRGDDGQRHQEIAPHQQIVMNMSGNSVFGNPNARHDLFATVKKIYWALMDDDRNELGDVALADLDAVIEGLLIRTTEAGARLNRVDAMDNMLFEETIFLRGMRSTVEDIDMAGLMTEYMMQESVYQAALATTARMMQPTLIDFMR